VVYVGTTHHAANCLRARAIELGVAANRVREATCDLASYRVLPLDLVNVTTELAQITARLHEVTRAIAREETPRDA
jgi:hypothetical protein